jgi:hypothetical protein
MMNAKAFVWICMFFLVSSVAFAASAKIITESTAPGCTVIGEGKEHCHVLDVNAGSGESVKYTIADLAPGTYTLSFMYQLRSGQFEFSMEPDFGVSPSSFSDTSWVLFSRTFTVPEDAASPNQVVLRFEAVGASAEFWIDELQLTQSPEPTHFNNFKYETGCCPFDYCWTGGVISDNPSCIHSKFYENNVSMPPIGWSLGDFGGNPDDETSFLDAPNGYRCINGTWKFSRVKFTPMYDKAGYCPIDEQCYNGDTRGKPEFACVDSGEFGDYPGENGEMESFYCYNGNWTTRTKEIALQLLNMTTKDDTYTLFCDRFNRALNSDETMTYYRDYVGDNIAALLNSRLANEFCVLNLNGRVIAGVSLSMDINASMESSSCVEGYILCSDGVSCDDAGCLLFPDASLLSEPKSFLQMLKGSNKNDYCDAAIRDTTGAYVACTGGDVLYNSKLKTVLFSKPHDKPLNDIQAVPERAEPSFISRIFDRLKEIIGNLLGISGLANPTIELDYQEQLDFVAHAGSFNKLYLSLNPEPSSAPRSIRAIRETRAHIIPPDIVNIKTFISAEYKNYQVDICRYFYLHNYPDLRAQISAADNIQCTPVILSENEWLYSVYVEAPVFEDVPDKDIQVWIGDSDSFWNDITAAIRTQGPSPRVSSTIPEPTFTTSPSLNPVVGSPIEFTIGYDEVENQNIIARTWDFGDNTKASSAYNITVRHQYDSATDYQVTLWVMDRNFQIRASTPVPINVSVGPAVSIMETNQSVFQLDSGSIVVNFTVTGGNRPYNVLVDWGDGTATELNDSSMTVENKFNLMHTYAFPRFAEGYDTIKPRINVTGTDRDGVQFQNDKEIEVKKVEIEYIERVEGIGDARIEEIRGPVLPGFSP